MTQTTQGGPYSLMIEDTYDIIEEEYENGNVDLGGGVPSRVIAERTGFRRGSVAEHVRPLLEQDRIERVWGIATDTNRPRQSYVPVSTPDGESDE